MKGRRNYFLTGNSEVVSDDEKGHDVKKRCRVREHAFDATTLKSKGSRNPHEATEKSKANFRPIWPQLLIGQYKIYRETSWPANSPPATSAAVPAAVP